MISWPSSSTCQPMPQAPSVGDSQLSSSKRTSWADGVDADRLERGEVRGPGCRPGAASGSPGTAGACRAGSGSRRSGRRRAAARAARSRPSRAAGPGRGRTSPGASCPRPTSASQGWWIEAAALRPEALEREDDLLQGHRAASRAISRSTRGERRSRSRWAAIRSRWKASSARAGRRPAPPPRASGGSEEEAGEHPSRLGRQVGPGGRPAVVADEAVRRRGGSGARPRRQRAAAGGAAVERRVEPVQLQQPGLEVAAEQLRARARLGRPHDGERQPVDLVLGLALGREGVEQLRAAGEEESRVEAARRPRGRPSAAAPPRRGAAAPRPGGRRASPAPRRAARAPSGSAAGAPRAPRATARSFPRSRVSRTTILLVSPSL